MFDANLFDTNLLCPSCSKTIKASDFCRNTYPGIHEGQCDCGFRCTLRCIGNHTADDFFYTRADAIKADDRRKKTK